MSERVPYTADALPSDFMPRNWAMGIVLEDMDAKVASEGLLSSLAKDSSISCFLDLYLSIQNEAS